MHGWVVESWTALWLLVYDLLSAVPGVLVEVDLRLWLVVSLMWLVSIFGD